VLWIDTNGTDPAASVLDVEPGDATLSGAASWALHKLNDQPNSPARIYTMGSAWPAVQAAVGKLPSQIRSHVHYRIADPTGVPHLVPGSDATQWYWGVEVRHHHRDPGFLTARKRGHGCPAPASRGGAATFRLASKTISDSGSVPVWLPGTHATPVVSWASAVGPVSSVGRASPW
jgi:hypothetical protein